MRLTATHERWLVILVVLHTVGVGLMLFLVPQWAVKFGGWERIDPAFFGRQAGIFHFVLATGYLLEYFRHRGVTLMVTAKCIALVFLLLSTAFESVPWAVPISGVADGAMALVVWWVHRTVIRGELQV